MNQTDFIKLITDATSNIDAAEAASVLKALQSATAEQKLEIIRLITVTQD